MFLSGYYLYANWPVAAPAYMQFLNAESQMGGFEGGYTAFEEFRLIGRGALAEVVSAAKLAVDEGATGRVAVFENSSGRVLDFDLRGSLEDVLTRLASHPVVGTEQRPPLVRRGPGRPKLGVVAKEVTLLPRHWEWLGRQRGGASAALRRLVDAARNADAPDEKARMVQDATYRFLSDMTGNLPGFEEASRALFSGQYEAFLERIASWPEDVRDHAALILSAGILKNGVHDARQL